MSDFQRLLERERQLAQERTSRPAAPAANGTTSAPRPLTEITEPHIRIESWRETADDDLSSIATARRLSSVEIVDPLETAPRSRSFANAPVQLQAQGLCKSYRKGAVEIPVLRGVDLQIHEGEFISIVGQSGCGKSTFLHLLGTLDNPDSGEVHFLQQRIDNLSIRAKDRLRNEQFGMIFQFYHLLPELTTLENVLTPLMIQQGIFGYRLHKRRNMALASKLLDMVGLTHRLKHKPRELSGGEMQRAAIARALISQPRVLLADEPTGNLDHATGQEIMRILRTLNQEQKLTIVMVTHDQALAQQADRQVRLVEGRVAS